MTTEESQAQAANQQAQEPLNQFMIIRTATNQVEYLRTMPVSRNDHPLHYVDGGSAQTHFSLRGDYPAARLWYYFNRETGAFSIGYPPVNPMAAWSERFDDARTGEQLLTLLKESETFKTSVGYMDAAARRKHDLERGGGGTTPVPAPAGTEGGNADSGC